MAEWIWYPGDFELYHAMLVHTRREEDGFDYPCMWYVPRPELQCTFEKDVLLEEETSAAVVTRSKGFVRINGEKLGGVNKSLRFPKGNYRVEIELCDTARFPAMFIADGPLASDGSWLVHRRDWVRRNAAHDPVFACPQDDPAVFPFLYKTLKPVSAEECGGGMLYDFGEEAFGPVTLTTTASMGEVLLVYGESREEALDAENAVVRETLPAFDGERKRPCRAFRWIFVKAAAGRPEMKAELEYLPIEDIASFDNGDGKLGKIWEIAARTFHLNSRECYLDGIKRDRWSWSGDAYQSFMVNRYLYFDEAIVRRTIRTLLGKPPYLQHVNTINEYSGYVILSVWDHYFATGDKAFVASVWPEVRALYQFIAGRLDENGYVVRRENDWIFIDWADIDKEGAVAAEQIVFWKVCCVMAELAKLMGEDGDYALRAVRLRENILRDYWDEERGAFIDSFTSGRKNITRHANIFALLYDFVDGEKAARITGGVLLGELAKPITTPYFKFFELMALAKRGEMEAVEDFIASYWGGMVDLGATTVWEQFDPNEEGIAHYAMYGQKFGRSLCHAWGSGPIALLGQYIAGVRPTDVAYESFEVAPAPGKYGHFNAVVPVKNGKVTVTYENGGVTALATRAGGVLKFAGRSVVMPAGEEVRIMPERDSFYEKDRRR